jgi:ABC-2 type transport system permease protein
MFIIIYGNMVMRSDRRKTNRIIEIIISSVKPFQLMIGKIIGTSLAGILQFFIWALIGLSLLFAASVFLNVGPTASFSRINGTGSKNLQVPPKCISRNYGIYQ